MEVIQMETLTKAQEKKVIKLMAEEFLEDRLGVEATNKNIYRFSRHIPISIEYAIKLSIICQQIICNCSVIKHQLTSEERQQLASQHKKSGTSVPATASRQYWPTTKAIVTQR
jgi:hypothetical protein